MNQYRNSPEDYKGCDVAKVDLRRKRILHQAAKRAYCENQKQLLLAKRILKRGCASYSAPENEPESANTRCATRLDNSPSHGPMRSGSRRSPYRQRRPGSSGLYCVTMLQRRALLLGKATEQS